MKPRYKSLLVGLILGLILPITLMFCEYVLRILFDMHEWGNPICGFSHELVILIISPFYYPFALFYNFFSPDTFHRILSTDIFYIYIIAIFSALGWLIGFLYEKLSKAKK